MSMHWSRRKFLTTTAAAPLIAIETRAAAANIFQERDRALLHAVMDEIIPASDGMPAASDAGGIAYLERIASADVGVDNEIRSALAALPAVSEWTVEEPEHTSQ